MGTANIALALVLVAGLVLLLGGGSAFARAARRWSAQRHEREIRREEVRQAQLQNEILEEKLRNEILRDISGRGED